LQPANIRINIREMMFAMAFFTAISNGSG